MGLFGTKKTAAPKVADKKKKTTEVHVGDLAWVIKKPRITEKAALLGDKNVYVFEVARDASKTDVKNAVVALFQVSPVKVNIVNRVPRTTKSVSRNRTVTVRGQKKAYVFLKKGDTINLI
jgi:large subunit ribosomal protein L23